MQLQGAPYIFFNVTLFPCEKLQGFTLQLYHYSIVLILLVYFLHRPPSLLTPSFQEMIFIHVAIAFFKSQTLQVSDTYSKYQRFKVAILCCLVHIQYNRNVYTDTGSRCADQLWHDTNREAISYRSIYCRATWHFDKESSCLKYHRKGFNCMV